MRIVVMSSIISSTIEHVLYVPSEAVFETTFFATQLRRIFVDFGFDDGIDKWLNKIL